MKDDKGQFTTTFETKSKSRFIAYIKNQKGEVVIPTYVIKHIDRPSFFLKNKKWSPGTIGVTCYDPIIKPSIPQILQTAMENLEKWNITVNLLDAVGEKIEEWEIKGALINEIMYDSMNYNIQNEPLEIDVIFNIDTAKLIF